MDEPARPARPAPAPAADASTVVIGGTAHLLATVPHLLGYQPGRSLVLLGSSPDLRDGRPRGRGEVRLTVRVDLPAAQNAEVLVATLAGPLAAASRDAGARGALVLHALLFGATDDQAGALSGCLRRLAREQHHHLHQVVLVRAGAWTVLDPGPGAWEPVPEPADVPAVAELVLRGRSPASGREEVAARVRRRDERAAAATDLALTLLMRGARWPDPLDALRELGAWVVRGEDDPGPAARARIVLALADRSLRDAVLGRWLPRLFALEQVMVAQEARAVRRALPPWPAGDPAALDRLLGLAARVPGAEAVPLLTVAGAVAWTVGEGTVANEAVDLALEHDPGCTMAALLRRALDHGMSPRLPRPGVA